MESFYTSVQEETHVPKQNAQITVDWDTKVRKKTNIAGEFDLGELKHTSDS